MSCTRTHPCLEGTGSLGESFGERRQRPRKEPHLLTHRAALALVAALVIAPTAVRAGTVWTAIASEKIRPETAERADHSAAIAAAKNEFEAFQVVVTGPATGVSATASQLAGPGTIAAPKLFREELIDLTQPSAADGATGRFPDPLVPDVDDVVGERRNAFPFDVPAGESRAIWVEVHVPADAKAGNYHGTVTIHGSGAEEHTSELQSRVDLVCRLLLEKKKR